jgi:diguanylate cyclase (GGDEF)-like protein
MRNLNELLTPILLLRVLVVIIGAALIALAAVVIFNLGGLKTSSQDVTRTSRAALQAAESEAELAKLQSVLQQRALSYLSSPMVAGLPESEQAALARELARTDIGSPEPGTATPIVPLSMNETIVVQEALQFLDEDVDAFADQAVSETTAKTREVLQSYYQEPSPGHLRLLLVWLGRLLEQVDTRAINLDAASQVREDDLLRQTSRSAVTIIAAMTIVGGVIIGLSLRITQMVNGNIQTSRREQAELAVTTSRLQFRNNQLNALYNVFTEITDTLSLEYVVNATLRESLYIMRADMATVRILRGSELVLVGAMTAEGQRIEGLPPIQLGVGPTGRTAKRGRTLRIDEGGERMMGDQTGANSMRDDAGERTVLSPAAQTLEAPMESGIIVPLVVGARVVGVIACWSRIQSAFNDEDQRVLEMMASQVATAIAAVDATEASERRAHQDALTALPNRRQLDEDLKGSLAALAGDGHAAVVAMVDIDYFKRLNDTYGHPTGDIALQRIAAVLRGSVRESDRVYRFGGEEFVVVFTDATITEVLPLAERLRTAVAELRLSGANDEPVGQITVSIGLALLPDHGSDVSALIDLADKAMYQAKSAGRDCVKVWSEDAAAALHNEAA